MKTSNKILSIFLGVIAVYMLVFALDLRLLGRHKDHYTNGDFKKYTMPLEKFNILKLDGIKGLKIIPSDSSYMEVIYTNDSASYIDLIESGINTLSLSISGDTAILKQSDAKRSYRGLTIYAPRSLKSFISSNSHFNLSGFRSSSLQIALNNSSLNSSSDSNFNNLEIIARNNSRINAHNRYSVDTLSIDLENSRAYFNKPIKLLSGNLINKSQLHVRHVDDIQIRKEKGSRVYLK